MICIQGKHYYAHTLIWLWMTGELPLQLDHKDCNPSNNKWNNLREANYSENMRNRYVRADNGVGFKGVRRLGNKYQARLTCDGKVHVKYGFDCPEEAHKAYCKMAETYHESFRRY